MSKYIVDIHGDIEGDYEIVRKYEEQEPIIDKIRAEINKLTVYYTTKDKGINLISQNAVNRILDKYKAAGVKGNTTSHQK